VEGGEPGAMDQEEESAALTAFLDASPDERGIALSMLSPEERVSFLMDMRPEDASEALSLLSPEERMETLEQMNNKGKQDPKTETTDQETKECANLEIMCLVRLIRTPNPIIH